MNNTIIEIPLTHLLFLLVPILGVLWLIYKWSLDYRNTLFAFFRMLMQLLLIGYFLVYIFESNFAFVVIGVLLFMVFVSSWIALDSVRAQRLLLYRVVLVSIALGGGITLLIVIFGILNLQPWYAPRYMIPLAGMIFANAMNSVSIAAERLRAETERSVPYEEARSIALKAALIPITNMLFAVGLVSLPGMMTGQILSGVSPLIAVRYQIMVMGMIFSASGISSACFLVLVRTNLSSFEVKARKTTLQLDPLDDPVPGVRRA